MILVISRSFLLRMRNVSDKFVHEIKTHVFFRTICVFENPVVYETTWKNIVRVGQAADESMAHGHCMLDT